MKTARMLLHAFAPLVLLALTQGTRALEELCPAEGVIKPCTCRTYLDGACIITCTLTSSAGTLEKVAAVPNLCKGNVHFVLVHSRVEGIPAALWKVLLASRTVDVTIKRAEITSLVPIGQTIPQVYTPGEAVIKIDHCRVSHWDGKQFANFYSEGELTIVINDTPLISLGKDFSAIASGQVHKVEIDNTGLKQLEDEQFARFENLLSLSLQNNELTSISRSQLPNPAAKLQFLHLNGNSLTSLPGDLFSGMPKLEIVYLRENNLKSLPQELFQSITSTKLQRIDFVKNPWECNCRLMWILKNNKYFVNMGECASPENLSQKKVKDLPQLLQDC